MIIESVNNLDALLLAIYSLTLVRYIFTSFKCDITSFHSVAI